MRKQAQLKELLNALAAHLRTRRRALGLTQERLAEKSGLSTNYIARLEIGTNTPSMATLICLSKALGMPVSELLALEPSDRWREPAEEIAHSLERMEEPHAEYVINQLRAAVSLIESFEQD